MKIAVNTRLLLKNRLEGIGWFTYETLKRITRQHPEVEFLFIFDRKFDKDFIFSENITPIVIGPQARHPVLFYLWFEYAVKKVLDKHKPDLFLSPDGYLSLRSTIPSLAVFHDLNFEHYPKDLPWLVRKYYKYFFPRFAKKATRIVTVSHFSANDISALYNISHEKIDVVYNGTNEVFKPLSEQKIEETRRTFSNREPYFLFVGALHPRKNLVNLFKAFDEFRKKTDTKTKLLIVGQKMWWTDEIRKTYQAMHFGDEVVFVGRLELNELKNVYGAALSLTFVSYFEGFGIPIIEAFGAGIPVITSNVTSLPEVAGDAAMLVDPFSVDSISDAMILIQNDENLRKSLIEKGLKRKQEFTWQKSADDLFCSIIKSVNSKNI